MSNNNALTSSEAIVRARHVEGGSDLGKRFDWAEFRQLSEQPSVDEAIRAAFSDQTEDNTVCMVRAIIEAAGARLAASTSSEAAVIPWTKLALSPAAKDILHERTRQCTTLGWTTQHDDEHDDGSLALAAGCYCEAAVRPDVYRRGSGAFAVPKLWPMSWDSSWWRPSDPRRNLVKAAALILAEIERLDRAASATPPAAEELTVESITVMLCLVGLEPKATTILSWTQEERHAACDWAAAVHFHASDNDDVIVPPRPAFLPETWQGPDNSEPLWGRGPTVF